MAKVKISNCCLGQFLLDYYPYYKPTTPKGPKIDQREKRITWNQGYGYTIDCLSEEQGPISLRGLFYPD